MLIILNLMKHLLLLVNSKILGLEDSKVNVNGGSIFRTSSVVLELESLLLY
jgi:acetyl-CoA acetyltransferase